MTTDDNDLDELAFGSDLEPGTYPAKVTDIEPVRIDTADEAQKPLLRWTFDIEGPNGELIELDALSSRSTSPRSKPYAWTTAVLGRSPNPGERIKLGSLIGRSALATIVPGDNGFPKIDTLVPLPKSKSGA